MALDFTHEEKNNVKKHEAENETTHKKQPPPLTLNRIQGKLDVSTIQQMQRTLGNAAVQRMLVQRQESGATDLDDDTAQQISSRRGAGQTLDEGIAEKAGSVMGQDFSGVNVHTDSNADSLSRSLNAKAFTTGNDIFFRSGDYEPNTSDGQELIAHELTHVVQQGASAPAVQGKMTVNDPNDQYETEADKVADTVMSMPEDNITQRQDEEEELAQMKPDLQRQEEEEDLAQMKPDVQRQEEDEMME